MTRVPFTQNYRWHLPLLLLVFCCSFFINNGAIFADIMESRNIITAREMVYDHNWLVPTMNGELRLEKPPLPTWIAAITEMISPDNLPLQRAMVSLAVMLVLFFYKFATKLTGNRTYALVSSLVLCTSYNIILMGRTATWDIYCHAFMMGAIYYLYLALRQNPCKWTYFIGAGIFMGLSFLGKGPVSFYALLLPFVCAYILYYRKETQMKGKWIALAVMILIGIVLSTWWYAYIYIYHQEMASYVFHKESSSWSNHNVRSWYYYWQFFLETGVWSLLTLTTLLVPFWKKRVESSKEYLFCLSWMLLILFFLSLLPEKKTRYLLPILLPAALTMGHLFVYWIRQAKQKMPQLKDRVLYRINAYLIVVADGSTYSALSIHVPGRTDGNGNVRMVGRIVPDSSSLAIPICFQTSALFLPDGNRGVICCCRTICDALYRKFCEQLGSQKYQCYPRESGTATFTVLPQ